MNEIDFINSSPLLNFEQEFGNGYINITDAYFNEDTGFYAMKSELLDESHNMLGNLYIDGRLCHLYQDDNKFNIRYGMEINLEGDIQKILSLKKDI